MGLRIIGIEESGKAQDIKSYKDSHGFVRVIEITEGLKSQPAILP